MEIQHVKNTTDILGTFSLMFGDVTITSCVRNKFRGRIDCKGSRITCSVRPWDGLTRTSSVPVRSSCVNILCSHEGVYMKNVGTFSMLSQFPRISCISNGMRAHASSSEETVLVVSAYHQMDSFSEPAIDSSTVTTLSCSFIIL